MKKIVYILFIIALFFVSIPYAHAQIVTFPQQNPPINQRDKFETDLFTGSAGYAYPIKVPQGTNNLTPTVSLTYSSAGVQDPASFVGQGWQLEQNYIERNVNYAPWDTTQSTYKLHFQGTTYDLVYDPADSFFHTKIESNLRIQQFLTGGQNTTGMYWQVTTTDGTVYRFGYLTNSELSCSGQSYDNAWYIDQVQDTHNNHIYYTYTQSNGVSYPKQILYNNDQKREIDFSYNNNPSPVQVYLQGCSVQVSSILNTIQVKANGSPVHEYDLGYGQVINGRNSLQSITEKGSDGSALPPVTFGYNGPTSGNSIPTDFTNGTNIDADLTHSDVQLCDMTGSGYPDLVKTTGSGPYTWEVKVNNGKYFAQNWTIMGTIPVQLGTPNMRLMDVNGDGKCDVVQTVNVSGNNYNWYVWPNTSQGGNLSFGAQQTWENNVNFDQAQGLADSSLALIDMTGHGLPDIVHVGVNNCWQVYPNVPGQNTWNPNPPHQTWACGISSFNNPNIKIADMNGDGLPDLVESNSNGGPNETYNVYLNTGYSLLPAQQWISNASVDSVDLSNNNVVITDVNGSGLPSIVRATGLNNTTTNATWQYLQNNGNNLSTTLQQWFPANMDGTQNMTKVKMADLNGDGQMDVLNQGNGVWQGFVMNSNAPGMLSDIHTAEGENVHFNYTPSTSYASNGNLPYPLWVVSKMTVSNGLTGNLQTNDVTAYSYANGVYNYTQHEFRGFGQVTQTDPNGTVHVNIFAQDDAVKGKLTEEDINDASGNPYAKTLNSWSSTASNTIYTVNLLSQKKYTYDGVAANPKVTETDYQYDIYGNVTKKSELGDTSAPGNARYTYFNYLTSPLLWIVNKIADTYVNANDDQTKVSEKWDYYDGDPGIIASNSALFGSGTDGNLIVSGGQTVYTDNTRSPLSVSASSGTGSIQVSNSSGFAVGQEILIIQMQGNAAGTYEFDHISSINGTTLSLQTPTLKTYTVDSSSNSKAQVLVVPQYQAVTIQNIGILTAHAWDGNTGGIVAFRAQSVTINNGGLITASNIGFRGNAVTAFLNPGVNGEGTGGPGNANTTNNNGNGGGGGQNYNVGGGGGGGNGTPGANGAGPTPGQGGSRSGSADLTTMTLGGAGGSSDDTSSGGAGGNGGNGGGIIFAAAQTFTLNSGAAVSANGSIGGTPSSGSHGGSGGGAGGSIRIISQNASLGTNLVSATGGMGSNGVGAGLQGGNGGDGHIAVQYGSISGTTTPADYIYQDSPNLTKGDLTKEVRWLSGGTNPVTTYTYDSYGNQTAVTDADNNTTQTLYGITDTTFTYPEKTINAKNQISTASYDLGTGNLLSKTDPNGFTTTYAYDVFGRMIKEIQPYDSSTYPTLNYQYIQNGTAPNTTIISKRTVSGTSQTLDEYSFFDGLNRVIQTRVPAQDPTKQIVVDMSYDGTGQISKQSIPHADAFSTSFASPVASTEATVNQYDPLSRLIHVTNPDGTTTSTTYDHWTQTKTNENGHTTKYYDNADNKIIQVDEQNNNSTATTFYSYDTNDNLTRILDASSNATAFTYDTLNRKITQNDPDLGVWHYTYDGVGNLLTQTDNRNIKTTRTYDGLNRLATVTYPTDPSVSYTYDNPTIGTLSQATDSAGLLTYTYDQRLRKTQEQRTTDNTTWTTAYAYDSANRLLSQTNPDGEVLTYAYNPQGEIASIAGLLTNLNYNAQGKITQKTLPNGVVTNYSYNPTDLRLNNITTTGTAPLQNLTYTYDNVGNVLSIADALTHKTQTFTYDPLERLATAQQTNGYNFTYTYDPIGNLTQLNNAGNVVTYTYGQNVAGVHAVTSIAGTSTPTPTPTATITPTATPTVVPTATPTPVLSTRKNLFPNPSFEVDTASWGTDSDFSRTNTDSYTGGYAIKQVSTANWANFTTQNDTAHKIAVVPGSTYTLSFYYKLTTSGNTPNIEIHDDLPYAGNVIVGLSLAPQSNWTRQVMTFTAPQSGYITFRLYNNNSAVTAYYDGFLLEQASTAGSYFDGSYPSASWEGTPNNSISDLVTGVTPTPTATPTVAPTATPTVVPTVTPTPTVVPTATPTIVPTATPTPTPTPAGPYIAHIANAHVLSASSLTINNVVLTTGQQLIVSANGSDGVGSGVKGEVTNVTYNGASLTKIVEDTKGLADDGIYTSFWQLPLSTQGTANVVVTYNGTPSHGISATAYTLTNANVAIDATSHNGSGTTSSSPQTNTITTGANNALILDSFMAASSGETLTVGGSPQVQDINVQDTGGSPFGNSHVAQSTHGVQTMSWSPTNTGRGYTWSAISIAPISTGSATRKNLIPNPSFEVGTTSWAPDSDFTRVSGTSYSGTYAIKQVSSANWANFTTQNDTAHEIAVVPGSVYTLSFYYKLTINSGLGPNYEIHDNTPFAGNVITSGSLAAASSWSRKVITFTAPSSGLVSFRMYNNNGNVTAYYDAFLLEKANTAGSYFDGSYQSASWEGTPNNSISDLVVPTPTPTP